MIKIIDSGWDAELASAITADPSQFRIVCPFIKHGTLSRLLKAGRPRKLQVITRFNLADFASGVSDVGALRLLLERGAAVRGVRGLHAKLYLFGDSRVMVTSANLTNAALRFNREFGFVCHEPAIVAQCHAYFNELWAAAGQDLTLERLESWEAELARYLAHGAGPGQPAALRDEGVTAGTPGDPPLLAPGLADAPQYFVKFLGESNNRAPLSLTTLEELHRSGCHWAIAYPASKRPTGVQDGAVMFIARLTRDPADIQVIGRATALRYVAGRDDATAADVKLRPWKAQWSRYIRVHHAEFVQGTLANGVSLNELKKLFGPRSFASTLRNLNQGSGNTNPDRAYQQQAAAELTVEAAAWLDSELEAAFQAHGMISPAQLAGLDWPTVPTI